jgi:hypothetical protein
MHKSDLYHVYFLSHLTQQSVYSKNANFAWSANWKYLHNKLHMRFLRWSSARRANVLLKRVDIKGESQCARAAGRGVVYILYAVFPTAAFLRTHNTH